MDWQGLLKGELDLTLSIILGLAFGMVILRTGAADKLMKHMMPLLRRFGIGYGNFNLFCIRSITNR